LHKIPMSKSPAERESLAPVGMAGGFWSTIDCRNCVRVGQPHKKDRVIIYLTHKPAGIFRQPQCRPRRTLTTANALRPIHIQLDYY
jgi:hypothetical protein